MINSLLPKGADKVTSFPRREEARFGEEGAEDDSLFVMAMAEFKADAFGTQHCQSRVIKQKLGQVSCCAVCCQSMKHPSDALCVWNSCQCVRVWQVGLFGDWLQRHKFGKFVEWLPGSDDDGWMVVAVQKDGQPRVPSPASLNQYILVQVR